MPHDKNGLPLAVGDRVNIPAVVKDVQPGEEYCNVQLTSEEPMYPGDQKSGFTLNAKQVVKVVALMMLLALIGAGCVTSKQKTITGNPTDGYTTNIVVVVNTNNLAVDSAIAQVTTAIAVNAALNATHNDPQVIAVLKQAQAGLGGILDGTNPQTTQQIVELLKAQGNVALTQQVTTLVGALSAIEQGLLSKYGQSVSGQITIALTRAVYSGLTVGLAGH